LTRPSPAARPGEDLGFVGLGHIGGALAANLVADGHRLTVYDLDPAPMEALAGAGARAAPSIAEVARHATVTFMSLPTPTAMASAAGEWLEAADGSGKVLVDLTTNSPAVVRETGARLAASGAHLVEAPLTGGAPGARQRRLVFLVGADDAGAFARVEPLLRSLGRAAFLMGPLGSGSIGKLANSLHAFASMWVTLESLALAQKSGVELRLLVDVLRAAGGATPYLDGRVEEIAERGRPPQFSLELAAKDAGLMVDAGRDLAVPMPMASALLEVLTFARASGLGSHDISDLVEVVERLAGVRLELAPPARPADG
jgi:2-hydroxy-3-oxopropionate reductase